MQQRAVAADVGQLLEPPLDLAIPDLGLQLGDDVLHERIQIDRRSAHVRTADAREREQIVDQLTHALRCFANALQPALLIARQFRPRRLFDH